MLLAKEWYNNNGLLHREDGPAIIDVNGNKMWHFNGNRHREDGPAVEWANGTTQWWIHGKQYLFDDYIEKAGWSTEQIIQWKLTHEE